MNFKKVLEKNQLGRTKYYGHEGLERWAPVVVITAENNIFGDII